MIDLAELRRLAGEGKNLVLVDVSGTARPATRHQGAVAPALVVAEATEALKQVDEGQIVGSVDRDSTWEVHGLILDSGVLARVAEDVETFSGLVEAIAATGLRWEIAPTNPL